MLRDQEADFILQNNKVVYPPVSTDGLELYYDVKGKKNSDLHKDKLLDMSGNDRHGELQSFSYKNLSGYQEDSELVFDGIDDTLEMPKLSDINPSNFTYQLNNNILAFTGDEVKTVKNGDLQIGGRNLLRNSDFSSGLDWWARWAGSTISIKNGDLLIEYKGQTATNLGATQSVNLPAGDYTVSAKIKRSSSDITPKFQIGRPNDDEPELPPVDEWGVITSHLKNVSGTFYIFKNESGATGTLEVGWIKVEKGSKATDWSPAPEDLIETTDLKGNILGDMEDIIDDHTRDEQSGIEVFTDKADDSLVRVEVDGKSYQPNYITNLFTKKTVSGNVYSIDTGVIIEIIQGHKYYTRRTFTSDSTDGSYGSIRMLGTDRHNFTGNGQSGDYSEITEYTGKTRTGEVMFYGSNGTPAGGEIENTFIIDLTGHFGSGNEPSVNEMDKLTDALGWFSGDKVYSERISELRTIPTPQYPIEIHSLNDFDVVSASKPRNVLVNGDFSTGAPGWTLRYNEGIWDKERQALIIGRTYMNESVVFQEKELKKGYKYFVRLQGTAIGATLGNFVYGTYKSLTDVPTPRKNVNLTNYSTGHSFIESEIVTPINSEYKYFGIGNNRTNNQLRIKNILIIDLTSTFGTGNEPSLEECDSIFREWHPAPEDISESDNHPLIDKINLSLSEPLRSVGDVKDRLFKDSDGLWKIERNVGERIVDGEGSFVLEQRLTNSYAQIYMNTGNWNKKVSSSTKGLSDRFPDIRSGVHSGDDPIMGMYTHNGYNVIRFKVKLPFIGMTDSNSNAEILTAFRNWLRNNNAKVIYELANPAIETLDQELQDKLNNLRSFQDSNYVYTIINDSTGLPSHISEKLKPTIHTEFLAKDHYKENRTVNNLLIWNRSLEDEELLKQNKLFHERFNMKSNTIEGEPINQTINLTQGGYVANILSLEYTIEI